MPSNIERLLIIMELTLQDILQTSFVIPLYPTTFTEISIPVPPAPGISGLPSLIYFDIDNRFSTEQRQRIKIVLVAYYSIGNSILFKNGVEEQIRVFRN
ncbi:hypothetical protein MT476_27620 (plasmid) [Bacillus sp. H8-1]|nr:hypothetical protein MT476_27620 [Bacillus sp. H8-1]